MKDDDDSIPLPDPFPIPKHFSKDVEIALRDKKMSRESNRKFITSVASAILAFKRYPTASDYENVGRAIILKYPFLRSPQGTPQVKFYFVIPMSSISQCRGQ